MSTMVEVEQAHELVRSRGVAARGDMRVAPDPAALVMARTSDLLLVPVLGGPVPGVRYRRRSGRPGSSPRLLPMGLLRPCVRDHCSDRHSSFRRILLCICMGHGRRPCDSCVR